MDPLTYRTVAVNGVELQVSVSNEGGERGLALLLHGFPELAFSWRYQIPALADAGYEVWAPNLRGYGASSKPRPVAAYGLDPLLDDIAGLVDASGHDKVTLIGHDWGAMLAWMFAIRDVRPLEGLVIMNVPHPACLRRERRTFRQLRKSWYVFLFKIPWLPEKILRARRAKAVGDAFVKMAVDKTRFPEAVTDLYRDAALTPDAMRSMINYYRASFRASRKASAEELPVIATPTLMVWGLEDRALGRHTTDGTDEHVASLTMRFLPDVSHWVQQEAPETVNAMLLAWLNGHEVPEAADITCERLDDPAVGHGPA